MNLEQILRRGLGAAGALVALLLVMQVVVSTSPHVAVTAASPSQLTGDAFEAGVV